MTITLDPQTERVGAEAAKRQGFASPAALVAHIIHQHLDRTAATQNMLSMSQEELEQTDVWRALGKAEGTMSTGMTTDEILELTRGEG